MKNRLRSLFENKKTQVLSIFYTAGFPNLHDTEPIAVNLQAAGVDIIEIGIPFSDPIADGPIIQASNKKALDNGMTVKLLLEQVKEIRQHVSIPIVLMGYLNPVYQYGIEAFIKECKAVGVDGLILPDLPTVEYEKSFKKIIEEQDLCMTFLISPTTHEDRILKIDSLCSGFVYAVSASSTTGTNKGYSTEQASYFERLQTLALVNPILIGFGIQDNKTFSTACNYASGAIIGSAFIKMLETTSDYDQSIPAFIEQIRNK